MTTATTPPGRFRRTTNLIDRLRTHESLLLCNRTPFEEIFREDIVSVRCYASAHGKSAFAIPVVLISPLAVNMAIYDLFPHRSLVRDMTERGFTVYLVDWGRPGRKHDNWNIATYITKWLPKLLEQVRLHAGTRTLSLHGWSFGGMFAYAYTAWSRDPDIRNIVTLGAPCDYHDNGIMGQQQKRVGRLIRGLGRFRALRPHASSPRFWRSPGWVNSTMYKATSPVASIRPYFDLLRKLDDREHVAAHATNAAFLDDMVAYPGAAIQDIVQYLFTDNVLGQGRVPVEHGDAKLSSISANLLVVTGRTGPVVTTSCSRALLKFVSSTDVATLEVSGGHMAIVSGKKAPEEIWPAVGQWLAERSGA